AMWALELVLVLTRARARARAQALLGEAVVAIQSLLLVLGGLSSSSPFHVSSCHSLKDCPSFHREGCLAMWVKLLVQVEVQALALVPLEEAAAVMLVAIQSLPLVLEGL